MKIAYNLRIQAGERGRHQVGRKNGTKDLPGSESVTKRSAVSHPLEVRVSECVRRVDRNRGTPHLGHRARSRQRERESNPFPSTRLTSIQIAVRNVCLRPGEGPRERCLGRGATLWKEEEKAPRERLTSILCLELEHVSKRAPPSTLESCRTRLYSFNSLSCQESTRNSK